MKRLFGFALLVALCGCARPPGAAAQFIGYVAQQTTLQSLTIAGGAPTPQTVTAISNLGQAAHTLLVTYGTAQAHCTTWLEASPDGVVWTVIASAPNLNNGGQGFASPSAAYAVGYYPLLRVVANGNSASGCTSSIKWTYIGYQFPTTFPVAVYDRRHGDIAASVIVAPSIEYPDPVIVTGFSCFNPNASVAYLQLSDTFTPPATLGTFILYEIGIPAGATFVSSAPIYSAWGLGAGAATAAGGGTAVGTPLVCSFQLNFNGPFGPVIGVPNSP